MSTAEFAHVTSYAPQEGCSSIFQPSAVQAKPSAPIWAGQLRESVIHVHPGVSRPEAQPAGGPVQLKVFLCTTGKILDLKAEPFDTVGKIKEMIRNQRYMSEFTLILAGKVLLDTQTIRECKIKTGVCLTTAFRCNGG
nr:PREDICTED: uncharacterized protein LOC106706461 isoform X2 [Latimeria chalumnae]|eukprot:XP_014352951.1 PREDICTED: uncharacterized protein LOC106706461 isoform X2 [Latimeria chalumnae]